MKVRLNKTTSALEANIQERLQQANKAINAGGAPICQVAQANAELSTKVNELAKKMDESYVRESEDIQHLMKDNNQSQEDDKKDHMDLFGRLPNLKTTCSPNRQQPD
ncbi:hypothetical protein MOUN0_E01420 [Monosporozyma unispora]